MFLRDKREGRGSEWARGFLAFPYAKEEIPFRDFSNKEWDSLDRDQS